VAVGFFGVAGASPLSSGETRRGSWAAKESGDDGRLSYASTPPTEELVESIEVKDS
jgi:hypothetical protein